LIQTRKKGKTLVGGAIGGTGREEDLGPQKLPERGSRPGRGGKEPFKLQYVPCLVKEHSTDRADDLLAGRSAHNRGGKSERRGENIKNHGS